MKTIFVIIFFVYSLAAYADIFSFAKQECMKNCDLYGECCKEICNYSACIASQTGAKWRGIEVKDGGTWAAAMAACQPHLQILAECAWKTTSQKTLDPPTGLELGPDRDGWGFNNQTATILRYFGSTSGASCRAECEKDSQCMAFSWIRPNGYVAGDPPMCYLMSSWTGGVQHPCCISAVKNSPTHGGDFEAFGRPTGEDKPKQPTGSQRWILESVTNNLHLWNCKSECYGFNSTGESSVHMYSIPDKRSLDFQWTAPPQQIDSNGFTVSMSIQISKSDRVAAVMHVSGIGIESDTDQRELKVMAEDGSTASGQKSVTFKPVPNASELEVNVSFMLGPNFKYKYRRAE